MSYSSLHFHYNLQWLAYNSYLTNIYRIWVNLISQCLTPCTPIVGSLHFSWFQQLATNSEFFGFWHWLLSYPNSDSLRFILKKKLLLTYLVRSLSHTDLHLTHDLHLNWAPDLNLLSEPTSPHTSSLDNCSWLCACLCQCSRPSLTWSWLAFFLITGMTVCQVLSYMEGTRTQSHYRLPWLIIVKRYLKCITGEKHIASYIYCFTHVGHSRSILFNQVNFYKSPILEQLLC